MNHDLVQRLAPRLATVLEHPGDEKTPPFPVIPLPTFQTATLPPGMAQEMAEQAGLPHPDFARIYFEAWLHLLETEGDVTVIDNTELADLRAAAAAVEHKRDQPIVFTTPCGARLRAMVRGFDTQHPQVPCELVNHQCGVKA